MHSKLVLINIEVLITLCYRLGVTDKMPFVDLKRTTNFSKTLSTNVYLHFQNVIIMLYLSEISTNVSNSQAILLYLHHLLHTFRNIF